MASIVIVTTRCYLICEAINHITVNELKQDCADEKDYSLTSSSGRKKKKKKAKKLSKAAQDKLLQVAPYQIMIDFIPTNGANTISSHSQIAKSGSGHAAVAINVYGRDRAIALFSDVVRQIREQLPDQPFLDKLVENFLMSETQSGNLPR